VTDPAGEQPPSAERLIRGAQAAQSLSEAVWETLHEALAEQQTERAAELCEQLAQISRVVASLTAAEDPRRPPAAPREAARSREPAPTRARGPGPGPACGSQTHDRERGATAAILVDELVAPKPVPAPGRAGADQPADASIEIRDERAPAGRPAEAHAGPSYAEHARTDQPRTEHVPIGQAWPWQRRARTDRPQTDHEHVQRGPVRLTASIERRLEHYRQDRQAFALLLLELSDAQRLRYAELPAELVRLTGLVEAELGERLRPADSLMRESPGRYWLLAPHTDDAGAQTLAGQLTDAVSRAASHRGAPLRLAVGIAGCPRDALSASELIERAEVALYQAHASGRALLPPPGRL
jgi:GGDEF domain-containing protein